jgi:hypothetical protein
MILEHFSHFSCLRRLGGQKCFIRNNEVFERAVWFSVGGHHLGAVFCLFTPLGWRSQLEYSDAKGRPYPTDRTSCPCTLPDALGIDDQDSKAFVVEVFSSSQLLGLSVNLLEALTLNTTTLWQPSHEPNPTS